MITNYIAGADAVLLCYDITNYESFANLEDWYRLVLRTFYQGKMPYVALLGNKSKCDTLITIDFNIATLDRYWTHCLIRNSFHNSTIVYSQHADDLKHLTAVRAVQHNKFAEENGLASFMMSAKNGDQVTQAFWKVASTLAGEACCCQCCLYFWNMLWCVVPMYHYGC